MTVFTPKIFALCIALVVGPPLAVVAYHWEDLKPKPVDPLKAEGHVLFFTADWCGVCQRVKPTVAEVRSEGFDIRTVDVDSHRRKAMQYGIHGIPTFVLVRDGQEVRRASGGMSPARLRELFR